MSRHSLEDLTRSRIYVGVVLRTLDRAHRAADMVMREHPEIWIEVDLANPWTPVELDLSEMPEVRVIVSDDVEDLGDIKFGSHLSTLRMKRAIERLIPTTVPEESPTP